MRDQADILQSSANVNPFYPCSQNRALSLAFWIRVERDDGKTVTDIWLTTACVLPCVLHLEDCLRM